MVGGGSKPGRSTDHVSTAIAVRVNAPYVINLSNIKQAYTEDPKKNPDAKPQKILLKAPHGPDDIYN